MVSFMFLGSEPPKRTAPQDLDSIVLFFQRAFIGQRASSASKQLVQLRGEPQFLHVEGMLENCKIPENAAKLGEIYTGHDFS